MPRKRPSTKVVTQELMGDAMKTNEFTTAKNRRKRQSCEAYFDLYVDNVVEVFGEGIDKQRVQEDSVGEKHEPSKKATKGKIKRKSMTFVGKKVVSNIGKVKESQKKRETSKRKREPFWDDQQISEKLPSHNCNLRDNSAIKKTIIDNFEFEEGFGWKIASYGYNSQARDGPTTLSSRYSIIESPF